MTRIEIKILLFGACKDAVGRQEISLELDEGSSVATAFELLKAEFPELTKFSSRLLFAVNETYALKEDLLKTGDCLAILPPVSGGNTDDIFQLTYQEIDSRKLALQILQPNDGAIVTFEGVTRDHSLGRKVLYLEYEAYEPMAIKMMREIATEARQKWSIDQIAIVHRLGRVDISSTSVAIVVTSAHRKVAFEACHFLIDRLKEVVPIWKREYYEDGNIWIDPQLQSRPEKA